MTFILSGFADEISPSLDEQLAVLAAESISHLELRSVWSTNVADLGNTELARVRRALGNAGVRVSAIGSPVGKIDVRAPLGPELARMRRVADIAAGAGTAIVRVFSFFIPPGEPPGRYRQEVIDRMAALAAVAEELGLVLAHENEKGIYGDRPERCAELIAAVGSPALRATFDAANFVRCGVRPHAEGYGLLRPYLVYLQVKDALWATGEVVPAGQGDGEVRDTLAALNNSGFEGYVSLEHTWHRRDATAASAGRTGSAAPPRRSNHSSTSCRFPGDDRPGRRGQGPAAGQPGWRTASVPALNTPVTVPGRSKIAGSPGSSPSTIASKM
jgi:sugar phosphate isomerase/epimerase